MGKKQTIFGGAFLQSCIGALFILKDLKNGHGAVVQDKKKKAGSINNQKHLIRKKSESTGHNKKVPFITTS